jgi:hypothetical protein
LSRALWITWYDLNAAGSGHYLDWLHHAYIPMVLERPGLAWGAHYASEERTSIVPQGGGQGRVERHAPADVPDGYRFILMFGGDDPYAFVTPTRARFHASLSDADRDMLALRSGERSNLMLEEGRVLGPAASASRDDAPGPCIQLGSFNAISDEFEDDIAEWYAHCRLPSLKDLAGCIRARKLVSVSGWAKHAALYEFTSLAARNDHFVLYERMHPEMEAWSVRVVKNLVHAPNSSNVAQRIWPA